MIRDQELYTEKGSKQIFVSYKPVNSFWLIKFAVNDFCSQQLFWWIWKAVPPDSVHPSSFPPFTVHGQMFYPPHLFNFWEGTNPIKIGGYELCVKVNNGDFNNFICAGFNSQGSIEDV